jgi:transposase
MPLLLTYLVSLELLGQSSNVTFSKVEMSPFVILKPEFQHERDGAGGAPTTNEPTRVDAAGSDSASLSKRLRQRQAAELLSVSVRQVKRLCKAYQAGGAGALISKRRGQPSNNRLPEKTKQRARRLLRTRYHDFGPTFATEKLAAEGLRLSVETVRQLQKLRASGKLSECGSQ